MVQPCLSLYHVKKTAFAARMRVQDVTMEMEGNVSLRVFGADHHSPAAIGPATTLRSTPSLIPVLLALALVLLATLAWVTSAHAATDDAVTAKRTAQQLLARLDGKLEGATAGEPVLVHSSESGSPEYFIVPLERNGRTLGLAGVSADGRSWQWYTDTYSKARFPSVSRARARTKLGAEPRMVSTSDNRLYWSAASGGGTLLSADDATKVRTRSQVAATEGSKRDSRPGRNAVADAQDPVFGSEVGGQFTAQVLPVAKNLAMPHYYQVNSYFCGPATLQMLFDHYNPAVGSQDDVGKVANAKDWGSWSGAYSDDLVRTARFSHISSSVQDATLVGFKERALGYGAVSNFWSYGGTADPDYESRYTDLKQLIVGGHPVLVLTWYDSRHVIGHFRVVKGYDDSTGEFIVHDPWYSAPYYGPDVHFKQEFFVDDLWTKYNRWGVTMSPWKVGVSAPASTSGGSSVTVSATVLYVGPHPMEGRAPVTNSQATLSVPSGFSVSTPTVSLPGITESGTVQTVSWQVTVPMNYNGAAAMRVAAKGQYDGNSTSYGDYTDWVGGTGSGTMRVTSPTGDNDPITQGISPTSLKSAPNEWRTVKTMYSDMDGATDLRSVMLLAKGQVSGNKALYASYSQATNLLYLRNAANSAWLGGVKPGTAMILDNGYARLDVAKTIVSRPGSTLTISWVVSESPLSSGDLHNVYLQAQDSRGVITPWVKHGTWLVNRTPVAGAVADAGKVAVSGVPVAVRSAYSDPDGLADLENVQLLLNTTLTGTDAVWLRYDAPQQRLYMRNGDNSGWLGPITPGETARLDNGRAILDGQATTISAASGVLNVNWGLRFKQSFSGRTYNLYSVAADQGTSMLALPWVKKGTYGVSVMPVPQAHSPALLTTLPERAVLHTVKYLDADGAASIDTAEMLVGSTASATGAVLVRYDANANKLYLRDSANTQWLGGITPGTSATVTNSSVTLNALGTKVSRSGSTLTIQWSLSYKPLLSGRTHNVYSQAQDAFALRSGWKRVGRLTVNHPPKVGTVSPKSTSSVAGALVTLITTYTDGDGANSLSRVWFIVNNQPGAYRGMLLRYDVATNRLWMRKADLSGWVGGVAPGSAVKVATGYASLDIGRTSVSRSGTQLTVRWAVSFSSGMKNRTLYQYMAANDVTGAQSGTVNVGTWLVR